MSEDDDDGALKLIENERAKLFALMLNTVASGSIVAGVVIPGASILAGIMPNGVSVSPFRLLASAIVWLLAGLILHLLARRSLGRLRP